MLFFGKHNTTCEYIQVKCFLFSFLDISFLTVPTAGVIYFQQNLKYKFGFFPIME